MTQRMLLLQWAMLPMVCLPFSVMAASAQEPTGPELRAELVLCKSIRADSDRLGCVDALLNRLEVAPQSEPAVEIGTLDNPAPVEAVEPAQTHEPAQTQEVAELGVEDISRPKRKKKSKAVSLTLAEAGKNRLGKYYFVFENGQRWQQAGSETRSLRLPKSAEGTRVTIRRGAFGSHVLSIDGDRRSIKVVRLE